MVYKSLVQDPRVLKEEFGVENLTKRVIVCPIEWKRVFPDDWMERLKEKFDVSEIIPGDHYLSKIDLNYKINNTLFLFIGRGLIEALDRLYILVRNPDVEEIIFVGSAASISEDLDTGDINIPMYALPLENISSLYVDISSAIPIATKELLEKATKIAKEKSRKYEIKVGNLNHATIPLFYSETEELLEFLTKFNVASIDMELSGLYRLANYYEKKAVGILRIGDRPLHKQHIFSEIHKSKEERKKKGKEVLFEVICEFIQ